MDRTVMQLYRCLGCAGVYSAFDVEGRIYHHVCAPIPDPDTGEPILRPGHRDERIKTRNGGRAVGLIAEGAGTEPLTKGSPAEPRWITELKAKIAKSENSV